MTEKERSRAKFLAKQEEQRAAQARLRPASAKRLRRESRSPVWGTQEWAETRGDDLGYSGDR